MPHATEPDYKLINVQAIHPTFAADVTGVDFSAPVSPEVFQEILKAIATV